MAGNAAIDGTEVYKHYRHFVDSTADIVEKLPKEPSSPGAAYRSEGGLIKLYMRSPTVETLNGILGPLSIKAYNHIINSFAAFFRLRNAIMLSHKDLPNGVQSILDANKDSCIQELRSKKGLDKHFSL